VDESEEHLRDLLVGNRRFAESTTSKQRRNIDPDFSIVVGCIDSRGTPSVLFNKLELGKMLELRTAGGYLDVGALASLETAVIKGAKRIIVKSHTGCGAVEGSLGMLYGHQMGNDGSSLYGLLKEMSGDISSKLLREYDIGGDFHIDTETAAYLNARIQIAKIMESPIISRAMEERGLPVYQTHYNILRGLLGEVQTFTADNKQGVYGDEFIDLGMKQLKQSNRNFANSVDLKEGIRLGKGQEPHTLSIGCWDSLTTPANILGGVGLGTMVSISTAGGIIGGGELASAEFAVKKLGVKQILYISHSECETVGHAVDFMAGKMKSGIENSSLFNTLVTMSSRLGSGISGTPDRDAALQLATLHNANAQIEMLMRSRIIRDAMENGMPIHHLHYEIKTGLVSPVRNFTSNDVEFKRAADTSRMLESTLRKDSESRQKSRSAQGII
jgi:carbonic anhydrase